ncbi:MAG TPA: hypothetical protein VLV17_05470 [Anaeromyxobacteraceae bacterium]|nr:hypothetical protein [Anaeromyxobacteraceae bacterium]
MTDFSPRLSHLFPSKTLARLIAATYAQGMQVDEEEAHERLLEALAAPAAVTDVLRGIAAALGTRVGPRASPDSLLDRLSARLGPSGGRVRAAKATPAMAAVLVRLNLEIGLSPETMRATLAGGKGAQALEEGLNELGAHIVKELLRR